MQALDDFRDGKADFLLATDLAGRGLDIRGVSTVINYELPTELKTYIHRVGRTARAGSEGRAVSIVAERDRAFLKQVLKHAADVVRTRTVPSESTDHWIGRIAAAEEEVREVLLEEREVSQAWEFRAHAAAPAAVGPPLDPDSVRRRRRACSGCLCYFLYNCRTQPSLWSLNPPIHLHFRAPPLLSYARRRPSASRRWRPTKRRT